MCMHISEQKSIAKLLFLSSLLKYFLNQTFKLRYNLQVYKVFKNFHDNLWKSLEQDNLKLQFPAYTCGNDGDKITIIQDHKKNQGYKRECQISQHIFFLPYLTCKINLKSWNTYCWSGKYIYSPLYILHSHTTAHIDFGFLYPNLSK